MQKLIFLGTEYKKGKGGVASVLLEYVKLFPDATFISTTASQGVFKNAITLIAGLIKLIFNLIKYPKAIVHIHGSSYRSFFRKYFLFRIIRVFSNKVIYHIHGGGFQSFFENESLANKGKINYFINNVDCVVCLSSQWENFYKKKFNPKRIVVIPNIVASPKTNKRTDSDYFNFLFLGDISEQKGVWLMLDVIKELRTDLEGKFKFLIGGNGEVDKLNGFIIDYELEDIVEYIGWVSNETKQEYLNKANAYILPSYNEGLPISILEAMTYGLPIISTNVGGIPELVKTNFNGLLIESGNVNALVEALQFVLENTKQFKSYGANSLTLIAPYKPENVKVNLLDIYKNL